MSFLCLLWNMLTAVMLLFSSTGALDVISGLTEWLGWQGPLEATRAYPCSSRATTSRQLLKTSREETTSSLGSPCQRSLTCTVQKRFLMYLWPTLCCGTRLSQGRCSLPSSTLLEEWRMLELLPLSITVDVWATRQSCKEEEWHTGSWKSPSRVAAAQMVQTGPLSPLTIKLPAECDLNEMVGQVWRRMNVPFCTCLPGENKKHPVNMRNIYIYISGGSKFKSSNDTL